jgi:A/G-specific adenine glycosylase
MLQQTQVIRVIPAWHRFLEAFPDPGSCAGSSQAAVVRAWEGLGYHRRAVALFKAATVVTEDFGGQLPESEDELRGLPGVGRYTARAVRAFAFEHDVGVVDINVTRVLSRAVVGRAMRARTLQVLADALVPIGEGWRHNQALLDFGAMRCKASPACSGCPLRRSCRWAQIGFSEPDPARISAGGARPQISFAGSDRQLRGRLVGLARQGQVGPAELEQLAGEFGGARVEHQVAKLIDEGLLARWANALVLG